MNIFRCFKKKTVSQCGGVLLLHSVGMLQSGFLGPITDHNHGKQYLLISILISRSTDTDTDQEVLLIQANRSLLHVSVSNTDFNSHL